MAVQAVYRPKSARKATKNLLGMGIALLSAGFTVTAALYITDRAPGFTLDGAICAFSVGTTIGWISPTIIKLLEPDSPVRFTPEDISTMVAAGSIGHLSAPFVSNQLVDRFGRRSTMLISGLPMIVSSALIMVATHVWVIHVARVMAGLSLGMCVCVTPMYMGEIALTKGRGAAGSSIVVMVNLGILFAYGICPYLSIPTVAGILMTITLAFEVSFWFMPETPYYLTMVGRFKEAEAILERLRGKTDVKEEADTIKELMPKREDLTKKKAKSGTLKDVFTNRVNLHAFAIAFLFLIPQYYGGFIVFVVYTELVFRDAGSAVPSHLASIAVGVAQLISSIASGLLIDRLGRKPLILGAGVVAGAANFVIGGYLYAKEYMNYDVSEYTALFLVAAVVQISAFNCGLVSTQMVLMSEIFATEVKGISMSIMGVCGGLLSALATKLYIAVAITWGFGHSLPFLAFGAIVWFCTALILHITPETKGKTFAQIRVEFNR